mmetsp:Transcript_25681/g.58429  ORF Transcript_25681/g.58429 Transcript_25681/m.58429 type:complete len:256 (-) Transcript_25681:125-892(-)
MSLVKFDVRLREMVPENSSLVVVGAHLFGDDPNDPIYSSVVSLAWSSALLVEANPKVADSLRARVSAHNPLPLAPHREVRVVHQGVCPDDTKKIQPFYTLQETPGLPFWASQIGSFSREHVELPLGMFASTMGHKHTVNSLRERITVQSVRCTSLLSLLQRRGVTRVGLLLIDAEGFDCDIVAAQDWSSKEWVGDLSPAVLVFEWKNCKPEAYEKAMANLLRHNVGIGYRLIAETNENAFFSRVQRRYARDDMRR